MADTNGATTSQLKAVPEGYASRTEGKATILQKGNEVFYNEAQVTNRDLSIAVLRTFLPQLSKELKDRTIKRNKHNRDKQPAAPMQSVAGIKPNEKVQGARILEGLAASGLRSIRYALEIDGIHKVYANDLDPSVVEAMKRNVEHNGSAAQEKVVPLNHDARIVMLTSPQMFDVVDLDPYGSPSMLLDSAVQAVADGGLLMVTATDMAVLCGNNGEACFNKYGSYPVHRPYCHEMALRIVLGCLEQHAGRYKRYIEPLLSLSVDFYVRVFVRIHTSAQVAKDSATKLAYLYQSQGCDSFYLQRVGERVNKGSSIKYTPGHGPAVPQACPETGARFLVGGPLWAEPIHNQEWVAQLLQDIDARKDDYASYNRIRGLLNIVAEELPDAPLYYQLHELCKHVKVTAMKADIFRSALINAGYRVSSTHATPLGVKTDAPPEVVWDIIRCWVKQHPTKAPEEGSYTAKLLAKEPTIEANFRYVRTAVSQSKLQGKQRFVENPANWGPKTRHGRPARGPPDGKTKAQQQREQEQRMQQQQAAAGGAAGGVDAGELLAELYGAEDQPAQQQEQQQQVSAADTAAAGETAAAGDEERDAKRQRVE